MRKDCKFIYDAEGNVIPTKSWPLPQEADYFQIYQLADANTLLLGLTEWCGVDDCESFEGQDREHRPRLIDVDVPYVKSGSNAVASEHEIVTHLAPLKVLPLEVGSRLEERLRRRGLKLPFLK